MKYLIFLITILISTKLSAADTLYIKVINENNELISAINYEIKNDIDEILETDYSTTGEFYFVSTKKQNITITISHIEYNQFVSEIISLKGTNETQSLSFTLTKKTDTLNQVVVSTNARTATQKIDRLVINVANNPNNTGASTLEVLEKSPGIGIDKEGNFTLKGKSKVMVLIDDKPTFMTGESLTQYLSNLPASDIKEIELMDNPPAKYDAAGNGGVINIVTNKKIKRGWNGLVNLGYMYSKFHKTTNNLQLNYGAEKFSFQLGYRQMYNEAEVSLYGLREFYEEDGKTIKSYLNQPTMFKNYINNHQVNTAIDYQLSKKSSLNFNFTGTINVRNNPNEGPAEWLDANKNIDSVVYVKTYYQNDWNSIVSGLGYQLKINDRETISADVNYLRYKFNDKNLFTHIPWGETQYIPFNHGYLPLNQNIYVAKVDYSRKTKSNWNIDAGFKYSKINTNNDAIYDNYIDNKWVPDTSRTNRFIYSEDIYSAYIGADKKMGSWSVKGGLRYENTSYKANTISLRNADSSFNRNYQNLFPSVFVQKEIGDDKTFGVSISRRIDRPAFSALNPFVFDINKYTTMEGNPYILPQFTWNFEGNLSLVRGLTTSLSYSLTKDYFSQLFISKDEQRAIYTRGNVGKLNQYSFNTTYITNLRNWWNLTFQSTLMYKDFQGFSWTNVNESVWQWQGSLTQQFKIRKKWNAEISGNYISRHQLDLQEILYPTGQVGMSIGRSILQDKASFRIGIRDMFFTQAMEGYTTFKYFGEYFKVQRDSRMLTVNFTYRFGKKVNTVKTRSGNISDELNRTGS